jgi:chorismate synthase
MMEIDLNLLDDALARRKPGQSSITTSRKEEEHYEILSGVLNNQTTGAPVGIMIRNRDQISGDYENLKDIYRPSHADYTYEKKYGLRDHRGSGRASARETVCRVVAGAFANMLLKKHHIQIHAFVSAVSDIAIPADASFNLDDIESNPVRCPHQATAAQMQSLIEKVKAEGDSVGGVISCIIKNVPIGLGEPVFDKLHADLGKAILSINACKGFETGSGYKGTLMKGSEHNDIFIKLADGTVTTQTNHSGGIQGGISNGNDIFFTCAFKPVSTISKTQATLNTHNESASFEAHGRHDPCVLPRAVPVVEAMAAIVLADHLLRFNAYKTLL